MKLSKAHADALIRELAAKSEALDPGWEKKVEELSRLCEQGISKTHIAFLGTVMLAKALNRHVDLFAIKPQHAGNNPNAFSARTLCHSVLVPLSAELGISIGVTGREPLNNQPYFRMTRLNDDTPVHLGGRAAFDYMVELVVELQKLPNEITAQRALHAFIHVRRRYQPRYLDFEGDIKITPDKLVRAVISLVEQNSEHGKRAQAVVAGLMDVFAGSDRVESGRINDPSRNHPGDVCIRTQADTDVWEKAIEVRDKPVSAIDVQIFGRKCIEMEVREVALVMVSGGQKTLDAAALTQWANGFGIGLTLFHGWTSFIDQALFWSGLPKPVAANRAVRFIHERLVNVEASPEAAARWQELATA